MNEDSFDLEKVRAQQSALREHGRLHWIHWLVLAISVLITIAAWNFSNTLLHSSNETRFDREANRVVDEMEDRLMHYEDALRGGAATLLASEGQFTSSMWQAYARALDLPNRYPGVSGIGVIEELSPDTETSFIAQTEAGASDFNIHPEHEFPIKLPIVYIEPMEANASALGLDVAFEENRRTAALLARDTGTPQISGPITLVQDDSKTPGFLFYMPFYFDETGFGGLVYAPLIVKNLISGVLGNQNRYVEFSILDGDDTLYDELSDNSGTLKPGDDAPYQTQIATEFYGRTWTFSIQSTSAFTGQSSGIQPLVVLISGLTIDVMLFLIFLMMARSNRKILTLADVMVNKLGEQTLSLCRKNSDLESFAHIVSHDLKTPIRAIHSLSQFIEEDVDDLVSDEEIKGAIKYHTTRIGEQVDRSNSLISGVLNYSAAGHLHEEPVGIDLSSMLTKITQSLSIPDAQITIPSAMPVLHSYPVQLTQIFENLIGNAYKYHPIKDECHITISVENNKSYYRFNVSDNGDGIAPGFHHRIFNPFVTLQSVPSSDSSGIGLSIVQKTVAIFGGEVGIDKGYTTGALFYFDWPKQHSAEQERLDHAA